MKKQLTTLVSGTLVIAGALSLSTTHARAANLTSTVLEDFTNWKTGSRACDAGTSTMRYDDCIGSFSTRSTGNDVLGDGRGSLLNALKTGVFGGISDWSFGGKQDAGATTQGAAVDLGFQWSASNNGSGTWSLAKAAENLYADVVISLKTATSWSAYYIQKGTALSDFQDMLWSTSGVELAGRNGNNGKDLSHASIFFANMETKTPEVPVVVNPEPVAPVVVNPEPVAPVAVNPEPVAPVAVNPEPVAPVAVNPEPVELENIPPLYQPPMEGVQVPTIPLESEPVDVPEPSLMLGLGLVTLLASRRRSLSSNR